MEHLSLMDRCERYVLAFRPQAYIPIHPKEYWTKFDSRDGRAEMKAITDCFDLPVVPMGMGDHKENHV